MAQTIAMRKREEEWQIESDLRAMQEAEEIRRDPKRLAAVQKMAKERLLELASVAAEQPAKK